jgi:hypothetical protein
MFNFKVIYPRCLQSVKYNQDAVNKQQFIIKMTGFG